MSPRRRAGRKLLKALLPIALLLALAVAGLTAWLVYGVTRPPARPYLVTPEKFAQLSDRGLKATEETWAHRDGTRARGWLMRGGEGAPAILLLHRYGADRSWLLNLGVKLNETSNFTVLLPDLRGHGEKPLVTTSTFGSQEGEDILAATEYLRTLKTPQGRSLVGHTIGVYGVELGAYAALIAAQRDESVQALVLDSVPSRPDDMLASAVTTKTGFSNAAIQLLTRAGIRLYQFNDYHNAAACTAAENTRASQVLLLSGFDAGELRASTETLTRCFPARTHVETHTDLALTGFTLASASPEQGESYDRRIIEFFNRTLQAKP